MEFCIDEHNVLQLPNIYNVYNPNGKANRPAQSDDLTKIVGAAAPSDRHFLLYMAGWAVPAPLKKAPLSPP